jgi:hypothetical protein
MNAVMILILVMKIYTHLPNKKFIKTVRGLRAQADF